MPDEQTLSCNEELLSDTHWCYAFMLYFIGLTLSGLFCNFFFPPRLVLLTAVMLWYVVRPFVCMWRMLIVQYWILSKIFTWKSLGSLLRGGKEASTCCIDHPEILGGIRVG